MTVGHCFISYSNADGLDFATKLATELEGGHPFIKVWFDKNEMLSSGDDWNEQIPSAISNSKCLLFVMSVDSTGKGSNCKDEWTWALKCKIPIICLWIDNTAEDQFQLINRQKIDFSTNFHAGLAKLKKAIDHLDSFEGKVEELNRRLVEANRALRRAKGNEENKIKQDIENIKKQLEQPDRVNNPISVEIQKTNNAPSLSMSSTEDALKVETEGAINLEVEQLHQRIKELEEIAKDPKVRKDFDETRLHLELIQNTISRISGNSALMKVMAIATVSAILIVFAFNNIKQLVLVAIFPIIIFWFLDTYYLTQERKFRGLYNDVAGITKNNIVKPFAMPINLYTGGKYSFWEVFNSITILVLYLPIIIVILLIYFFL